MAHVYVVFCNDAFFGAYASKESAEARCRSEMEDYAKTHPDAEWKVFGNPTRVRYWTPNGPFARLEWERVEVQP